MRDGRARYDVEGLWFTDGYEGTNRDHQEALLDCITSENAWNTRAPAIVIDRYGDYSAPQVVRPTASIRYTPIDRVVLLLEHLARAEAIIQQMQGSQVDLGDKPLLREAEERVRGYLKRLNSELSVRQRNPGSRGRSQPPRSQTSRPPGVEPAKEDGECDKCAARDHILCRGFPTCSCSHCKPRPIRRGRAPLLRG